MRVPVNVATRRQFSFVPLFLVPDVARSVHERRIDTHHVYERDILSYKVRVEAANLFAQNQR